MNFIKYSQIIYHRNVKKKKKKKDKNNVLKMQNAYVWSYINIWDGFIALLILFASHICLHRTKHKIMEAAIGRYSGK